MHTTDRTPGNSKRTEGYPVLSLVLISLWSLLFAVFVCGCGYSMHHRSSLPFEAIHLGTIENRTTEPKLQDRLHRALAEECLKQGISVTSDAGRTLTGTITHFDLRVLSEKANTATEYEVLIKGNFRLTDPEGKMTEFNGIGSPFIVSFSGAGQLNTVIGAKEQASEKALRDMAAEIIAATIYR